MKAPNFIHGLSAIADRYDALLCDAWGVIHNGVELFARVEEAMVEFRKSRGPVVVLTNAPRPSSIIPAQLDRLGLSRDAYDDIVTSGDATQAEIKKRAGKRAYRLGPEKDDALYDGTSVRFSTLEEADYIICTGLEYDQTEVPEDYRPMLKAAAQRGVEMICANPDIVVNWGGRIVYCAGALAEIFADEGGNVVFGGKPYAPIYDVAFDRLKNATGAKVKKERILVVGDGIATDIKGANNAGLDVLFIGGEGGIHEAATDSDAIATLFEAENVHAHYAMQELKW